MPFYDYRCRTCGQTQEMMFRKIEEAPPAMACDHCQTLSMEKLISPSTVRFKGDGYYETDEKTSNKRFIAEGSGAPTCNEGGCGAAKCD